MGLNVSEGAVHFFAEVQHFSRVAIPRIALSWNHLVKQSNCQLTTR